MEKEVKLSATKVLSSLPSEYKMDLLPKIREQSASLNQTIVVLDDDPTGTQTVHGIPVLTEWNVESLKREFSAKEAIFYILTNSRSLPTPEAQDLAKEIGRNLLLASTETGRDFFVISRSDSTLRGHYPIEVEALQDVLENQNAIKILIPAFFEGGRYTINDVHYVREGEELIPAAQTPFAHDKAFGYTHSDLKFYVEEKTNGKVKADEVVCISIDDLRIGGPEVVSQKLMDCPDGSTCVVNAASYRDLEVFALGMLYSGRKVVLRTAASIVPVLAGMEKKPLLSTSDFEVDNVGGVFIVVGSYVPKTTTQLEELFTVPAINRLEVDVQRVLKEGIGMLNEFQEKIETSLSGGKDVVVYTSRKLLSVDDHAKSLEIGNKVSEFMTNLVKGLKTRPKCVLAKGGITSSDTATKGLNVKRAMVMGQVAPGIPVWKIGPESRFPGSNYIVFPGNVGDDDTLRKVYETVKG